MISTFGPNALKLAQAACDADAKCGCICADNDNTHFEIDIGFKFSNDKSHNSWIKQQPDVHGAEGVAATNAVARVSALIAAAGVSREASTRRRSLGAVETTAVAALPFEWMVPGGTMSGFGGSSRNFLNDIDRYHTFIRFLIELPMCDWMIHILSA